MPARLRVRSIGPAASTRMFCGEPEGTMDQEGLYLAALEMAEVFRIQGDRLQLRTAEGSLVADYQVKRQSAKLDPGDAGQYRVQIRVDPIPHGPADRR